MSTTITPPLCAFHGDRALKDALVRLMAEHVAQDQLVAGTYGRVQNGKFTGCSVACSLHSLERILDVRIDYYGDHERFEPLVGVPEVVARLQDRLFEGLPDADQPAFACQFWRVIPVGADVSLVWPKLAVWLLTDPDHGVARHLGEQQDVAERVAALYQQQIDGIDVPVQQWRAARDAAADAAVASSDAARYAATAVYYAADAAFYAGSAATAIAFAATAAIPAAAADDAATTAAAAARTVFFRAARDEFLRLLATAPVSAPLTQGAEL